MSPGHRCKSAAAELEDHSPSPEGWTASAVEEECPATPSRPELHREAGALDSQPLLSHNAIYALSFPKLYMHVKVKVNNAPSLELPC